MAEYIFRGHMTNDGKHSRYYCPYVKDSTYTDKRTGTCITFENDCCFEIGVEASVKAATKKDILHATKRADFFECALTDGTLTIKRPGEEEVIYEADPNEGVWDNEVIEYLQDVIEDDLLDDFDDLDNWD